MIVGTPSKLLDMARWNGWDMKFGEGEEARRRKWVWEGLRSTCLTTGGWSSKKRTLFSVRIYALIWSVSDARNRPRLYRPDAAPAERRRRCARQTGPRYQLRRARLQDSSITARLPIQLHPHLRDDPSITSRAAGFTPPTIDATRLTMPPLPPNAPRTRVRALNLRQPQRGGTRKVKNRLAR